MRRLRGPSRGRRRQATGMAEALSDTGMLDLVRSWSERACRKLRRRPLLMEVCGTHTSAFGRSGLRGLLSGVLDLRSGPGCPVCVTPASAIRTAAVAAGMPRTVLATFGDMLRVPWRGGRTLERERSLGADVRVLRSPADAVDLAATNPQKEIVFFAVGFETTAPLTAAAIVDARRRGLRNFSVLCQHRLIPPAIRAILDSGSSRVDGFILPGHVGTVTGRAAFSFLATEYGLPGAVTGFSTGGLLIGLLALLVLIARGEPQVVNAYPEAVTENGNRLAARLVDAAFDRLRARWRGLGTIPESGLELKPELGQFDARAKLALAPVPDGEEEKESGCMCGDVLAGRITPPQCRAFGVGCTPVRPLGPCMVSTEGSCSVCYRYDRHQGPGAGGAGHGR